MEILFSDLILTRGGIAFSDLVLHRTAAPKSENVRRTDCLSSVALILLWSNMVELLQALPASESGLGGLSNRKEDCPLRARGLWLLCAQVEGGVAGQTEGTLLGLPPSTCIPLSGLLQFALFPDPPVLLPFLDFFSLDDRHTKGPKRNKGSPLSSSSAADATEKVLALPSDPAAEGKGVEGLSVTT